MTRKLFVCFDGTGNEPGDADSQDENVSNVLKLYLRAGGCLGKREPWNGQLGLYYAGPGTTGGPITRAIVSAVAKKALDQIEQAAFRDFRDLYEPGDQVSVFGFSRGAALARRFVSRLRSDGGLTRAADGSLIRFIGVFDTVLSEGLPQKDSERRDPGELRETGPLGDDVGQVYHLLSIDDPRLVFTPTLYREEERVHEIWFPGVHSDVGGGYREDDLSDVALGVMLDRATADAELTFMDPADVPASRAAGTQGKETVKVDVNDLAFTPSACAPGHRKVFEEQDLKELFDALGDRKVETFAGGVPILDGSFVDRVKAMPGYVPKNVGAHRIFGTDRVFGSLEEHR